MHGVYRSGPSRQLCAVVDVRPCSRLADARRSVVGGVLLNVFQEFPVERDDDPFLAHLADRAADGHIKIDGRHDAVAELLVDQKLDGVAVVRDGLVGAVPARRWQTGFNGEARLPRATSVEEDDLGADAAARTRSAP